MRARHFRTFIWSFSLMFPNGRGWYSQATGQNEVGPADRAQRSAAPSKVVRSVLDVHYKFYPSFASSSVCLDFLSRLLSQEASKPLSFSLPVPRAFRKALKRAMVYDLDDLFLICMPFQYIFHFQPHKNYNKIVKIMVSASQSHPKILPKCVSNRTPQKHAVCHRFLLDFLIFVGSSIFFQY